MIFTALSDFNPPLHILTSFYSKTSPVQNKCVCASTVCSRIYEKLSFSQEDFHFHNCGGRKKILSESHQIKNYVQFLQLQLHWISTSNVSFLFIDFKNKHKIMLIRWVGYGVSSSSWRIESKPSQNLIKPLTCSLCEPENSPTWNYVLSINFLNPMFLQSDSSKELKTNNFQKI